MEETLRILLFGCHSILVPRQIAGINTEVQGSDKDWSGSDAKYTFPPSERTLLPVLTDNFDFGVIGNNAGLGVLKAQLVPTGLRYKFIIVWNVCPGNNEGLYTLLGYQHFSAREGLSHKLEELWAERQLNSS